MKKFEIFLFVMVIVVLTTGLVVAEELVTFDNSKVYDSVEQKVTVVNTFGAGRTIADVQLNTPLRNLVPVGYQKVAEFTINVYDDTYTTPLLKMDFYNYKNLEEKLEKKFDYKLWGLRDVVVPDFKDVCVKDLKGNLSCYAEKSGSHIEQVEDWIDFDYTSLKSGKYKIAVFTQVNLYDDVEFVPTYFGVEMKEFASYVQSSGTKTTYIEDGINYTVQTFTSNGTLNFTKNLNVSILIVGGGGSGGSGDAVAGGRGGAGGGGAGGLIYYQSYNMGMGDYNVVVGAGGAAASPDATGKNGMASSLNATLYAYGGGYGATYTGSGGSGGSGGGGGGTTSGSRGGGTGVSGQGYNGGTALSNGQPAGAGGGGASRAGWNTAANVAGNGSNGLQIAIYNGTPLWYAGGGGGNAWETATDGRGGLGGGGAGSYNGAGTSGVNGTGGGSGASFYSSSANVLGGSGIVIVRYVTAEGESSLPSITLNAPAAYYNSSSQTIIFNTTVSDANAASKIMNVSLYIDGELNETNSTEIVGSSGGIYIFTKILSEGKHNWTIEVWNNYSQINNATREFWIDLTPPTVTIVSPTNTTTWNNFALTNNVTSNLRWNSVDTGALSMCWYSIDDGTTNTTVTCNSNVTQYTTFNNTLTYITWANDTAGNLNSARVSSTNRTYTLLNSVTYTSSLFETEKTSYLLNITPDNFDITAKGGAEVFLNGTRKAMTLSADTNDYEIWNFTYSIPAALLGNLSIVFNGSLGNTTTYYQTVNYTTFHLCDVYFDASNHTQNTTAGFNVSYLTINFKDEANYSSIKGKISYSTFNYTLGDGSSYKLLTYTNATDNVNYTFCYSPALRDVKVDAYIQYSGGTYAQRTFNPDVETYTNASQTKTLYLLSSGSWSTYQVINTVGSVISGVNVVVEREILGVLTNIESGVTDSAGAVTFYLNPDYEHTLTFSKTGYTSVIVTIKPSSTTYTVTMGGNLSSFEAVEYVGSLEGITWSAGPDHQVLAPNTEYNFSFTIADNNSELTGYRIELYDNNSVILASSTGTNSAGGTVSVLLNTFNNVSIRGRYLFTNGTGWYVLDSDYYWLVEDEDIPERGTLKAFFKYISTLDIFGGSQERQDYSRTLLFFIIIFIVFGLISYTTGFELQTAGGSLLLLVPIVWFASAGGFFTMNYSPLVQNSLGDPGFFAKYTVALITTFIGLGYTLSRIAEERGS